MDLWFEGESIMVGEAWQQLIRAENREITSTRTHTHTGKHARMHAHSQQRANWK